MCLWLFKHGWHEFRRFASSDDSGRLFKLWYWLHNVMAVELRHYLRINWFPINPAFSLLFCLQTGWIFFQKNLGELQHQGGASLLHNQKHEEPLFCPGCYPRTTGITVETQHSKRKNSFTDGRGKQGEDGDWQKPRYRRSLQKHSGVLSKSVPSLTCSTLSRGHDTLQNQFSFY